MNITNINEVIYNLWDIFAPPVFNFLVWAMLLFGIWINIIPVVGEYALGFSKESGFGLFFIAFFNEIFECGDKEGCNMEAIFSFAKESTFYFGFLLLSFIIFIDAITKIVGRLIPARLQINLAPLCAIPQVSDLIKEVKECPDVPGRDEVGTAEDYVGILNYAKHDLSKKPDITEYHKSYAVLIESVKRCRIAANYERAYITLSLPGVILGIFLINWETFVASVLLLISSYLGFLFTKRYFIKKQIEIAILILGTFLFEYKKIPYPRPKSQDLVYDEEQIFSWWTIPILTRIPSPERFFMTPWRSH